jgi:fucose 4-O-acetylase-like acetyltransferase
MNLIVNIVIYQIGWFACILGAANGRPLVGVLVVAAAVTWHLYRADEPRTEFWLVAIAAAIGAAWDSLLVATGLLVYPSGILVEGAAPYWIVALWVIFATTFNVSLRWFKQHLLLAALFGAAGGPLAFYAGARLDGVVFTDTTIALTALGLGWTLLMPTMMLLARRYNGYSQAAPARAAIAAGEG